jgi:hypothetical protein
MKEVCTYELIQKNNPGLPVISNKGKELVLTEKGQEVVARLFNSPNFNQQFLSDICSACPLCVSRFEERETTWRIFRRGYEPINLGEPFQFETFSPSVENKNNRVRIVVIDDNRPDIMAIFLANQGY